MLISIFKYYLTFVFICCFFTSVLYAQQTLVYTDINSQYKAATEYYELGNYSLAQYHFEQLIHKNPDVLSELQHTQAQYYKAMCAQRLAQPDAETLFARFIDQNGSSELTGMAYFQLGKIYFEKNAYKDAMSCFEKTEPNNLASNERDDYYFQYGYSNFVSKKFDDAQRLLSKAANNYDSKYYEDANYYYGVVAYFKKDYSKALDAFKRVEKNQKYASAMPYYITLIYFTQKKSDELLTYAVPKAKLSNLKYQKEINMIIGQTYFNQKKYQEALPYLDYYVKESSKVRKEDLYQLGYTQYQLGKNDDAIKNFVELNSLTDSIGQNAMYHLADAYLKTKDKAKANAAFEAAARIDYDKTIQEISLLNSAKLSYELGLNSAAISKLQSYITKYPTSPRINEARGVLGSIFETSRNYKDAIELLENIPNKDAQLQRTYQRVTFYRGLEMYQDRRNTDALALLNKSLQNPIDASIAAQSYFWQGDIYYKEGNYTNSFNAMQSFLGRANSVESTDKVSSATANYTIGYTLFKQGEYKNALPYFESVEQLLGGKPKLLDARTVSSQVYPDAIGRAGDCYFMQKNYAKATDKYDMIVKYALRGADYAYYQKGILAGLQAKPADKIANLDKVIKDYPESYYLDDAWYQKAVTYVGQEDYDKAITAHKTVIGKFPQSPYMRKSLLNLGLVYYNTNNYDEALSNYKILLRDYPKSSEAQDALVGIKDVYVAQGDADGYIKLIKQYPEVDFSISAQDSLTYQIAENYYSKEDCANAVTSFDKYLNAFPKGAFAVYAHFYRGQCLYSQQNYPKSRTDYEYVIAQSSNLFTEQALDKASRIALHIDKDYDKAFNYSKKLYDIASKKDLKVEALRNLVRSSYYLKKQEDLTTYSDLLLKSEGKTTDDDIEIYFYRGRLAYDKGNTLVAKQNLQQVASRTTNEMGAQARYYLAQIAYQQKEYDAAKALCLKVSNETASQEYWVVKSFILLSDVYVAKNDLFQAKATLNSIIDNYEPEDELKKEAREKLAKITKGEIGTSKLKDDSKKKNDYLEMEGN
jgi:TolA-binding protein